MRTETFSYPNRWSNLLICVFALFISVHSAHAQDMSVEIAKQQELYGKLQKEFTTSQARILSSAGTYGMQELAYGQLESVGEHLSSMNREFAVLDLTMTLASMVTDKRFVPYAKQYIELQRSYMAQQVLVSVRYIDKIMPSARDQETTRLLLEARDLYRSSADWLDHLKTQK